MHDHIDILYNPKICLRMFQKKSIFFSFMSRRVAFLSLRFLSTDCKRATSPDVTIAQLCPIVTRAACHSARNHYIQHHICRYVKVLHDPEYQRAVGMSERDALRELASLHQKNIALRHTLQAKIIDLKL